MRVNPCAAVLSALIAAAVLMTAWPADAQQRKQRRLAVEQPTRTIYYNAAGRRVIVVHRRSYLDAGTEVLPGERKFTDYVYPPNYSATQAIDPTSGYGCCWPLPGPFEPGFIGYGSNF